MDFLAVDADHELRLGGIPDRAEQRCGRQSEFRAEVCVLAGPNDADLADGNGIAGCLGGDREPRREVLAASPQVDFHRLPVRTAERKGARG